jgi:hypothetical protein
METAIWVFATAVIVALLAPLISYYSKISEFRQAWINELRADIANYIAAARKCARASFKVNELAADHPDQAKRRAEAQSYVEDAYVYLWRIKMRINPRNNPVKAQDDAVLQSLDDLLDPFKYQSQDPLKTWHEMAEGCVAAAREILKREWQVTKRWPLTALWYSVSSSRRSDSSDLT